jgi:putative ABC transport system substrate-binding protein
MITKPILIALVLTLAAPLAFNSQAQPARARIGVFFSGLPHNALERAWGQTFTVALANLGWVEGQNLALDWRYSEGRDDRRYAIVEKFVHLKVDVIVVESTPESVIAKRMARTIPLVVVLVGDPVGSGLVESLARPGSNITGTSLMMTDTAAKRLQLLLEAVPTARRVAVLGNLRNASTARSWQETQEAGGRLGLTLSLAAAANHDELTAAFTLIAKNRPDALVVLLDSLMGDHRHEIVNFAAQNRLPAIYGGPVFVEPGGLLVYSPDFHELWRRAAFYVDRILKGTKPGDLPIEQPTKFQLVVNLKTAKALGLTIPQSLLLRADEVIQ